MRLIIEYTALADCGGDSFTVAAPVVYSSRENFLVDFKAKLNEAPLSIDIGGNSFYKYHFIHKSKLLAFEVYTLDEWFAAVESKANANSELSENSRI